MKKISCLFFVLVFYSGCRTTHQTSELPAQIEQLVKENLSAYTSPKKTTNISLDAVTPQALYPETAIGNTGQLVLAAPTSFILHRDSLYIVDFKNHHIAVVSAKSSAISRTIGRNGQGPGEFSQPTSICNNGQYIFVEDRNNGRIQAFSQEMNYVDSLPIASTLQGNAMCNQDFVFVTKQSPDRKFIMQGFEAKPPFRKAINILPYLYSEKDKLMGFNQVVAAEAGQNIYAAYRTLPFVFIFNKKGDFLESLSFQNERITRVLNDNSNAVTAMLSNNHQPLTMLFGTIGKLEKNAIAISYSNKLAIIRQKNGKWQMEKMLHLFKNELASKTDVKNFVMIGQVLINEKNIYVIPPIAANDPFIYKFKL